MEEESEGFTWDLEPPNLAQKQAQRPEREAMARGLTVSFRIQRPSTLYD